MTGPLARRMLAVVGGGVAALVVLEVVLRLAVAPTASQVLRGLHRATPEQPWLYELVPNARTLDPSGVEYAINASGFRDREHPRARPDDGVRIALVGDSVSFGYGVALEDTFAKRLEGALGHALGTRPVEVLNLGVSGYNPYTEAAWLRGVVLDWSPDLVLVQFCVNDLNDPTLHFDASTMLALGSIPADAFPGALPASDGAAANDDAAADAASHAHAPTAHGGRSNVTITPGWCRWSRLCTLVAETLAPEPDGAALAAALAPHEDPSPAELAWLERLYAQMASDARARDAQLAVVVFPYATQLEPEASDRLQEKLRELGARADVPVIDLLPAFRRAARESDEPLFLDLWHPTARGHRVAARALLHELACAGLVPLAAKGCAPALSPSGS